MKKKMIAGFMALVLVLSGATVSATETYTEVEPRASLYLDSYAVSFKCTGKYTMKVNFAVFGTRPMDKIGAQKVVIQEWMGNTWSNYLTLKGENYPEFYVYNETDFAGTYTFEGFPNVQYRVIVTAYAEKNGGFDTRTVTSAIVKATAEPTYS